MQKSIGGLIFDTDTATALARSGDGVVLYRAPKGTYFRCTHPLLGEPEITILTSDDALLLHNRCVEKLVSHQKAFPFHTFTEA